MRVATTTRAGTFVPPRSESWQLIARCGQESGNENDTATTVEQQRIQEDLSRYSDNHIHCSSGIRESETRKVQGPRQWLETSILKAELFN